MARVCTVSGFQMFTVAIGWHIYELTSNVLDLGLVGLVEFSPRVLFMLHTGYVADRYGRYRIVAFCQTGQVLVVVTLVLGMALGETTRNVILVLAFALGTAHAFEMPTTQALPLNLTPTGLFLRAMTVSASAMQAATTVVPALGDLFYTLGASWVHVPTVTLYILVCVLTFGLSVCNQPPTQGKAALDSLFAGIHFIRSRPDTFGAISPDLFAVLLGGATTLLPVFAKDVLLTGPWGLGLLRSASTVSALAVSFQLARSGIECNVERITLLSADIFGLATIAFGLSKSFWLSLDVLAVLGIADMVNMVIRSAFVQLGTPDEMRGRVSAVNGLFIDASNQFGEFESGLTAHQFGTVPAMVFGGIGILVAIEAWMKLFLSPTQHDRLH